MRPPTSALTAERAAITAVRSCLASRLRYGLRYAAYTKALASRLRGPIRAQKSGRGGAIRTLDLLNPIQVRYQAAPRPEVGKGSSTVVIRP